MLPIGKMFLLDLHGLALALFIRLFSVYFSFSYSLLFCVVFVFMLMQSHLLVVVSLAWPLALFIIYRLISAYNISLSLLFCAVFAFLLSSICLLLSLLSCCHSLLLQLISHSLLSPSVAVNYCLRSIAAQLDI